MTPTDFQFRMHLPCDARLVPTVRDLAAHAVRYAALQQADADALVDHVERAAVTAMQVAHPGDGLDLDIRRDPGALLFEVRCPAGCVQPAEPDGPDGRVSVQWADDGSRCACVIALQTG